MNQSIAQRVTGILSLVSGAAALLTASAAVLGDRLFAYFFFRMESLPAPLASSAARMDLPPSLSPHGSTPS